MPHQSKIARLSSIVIPSNLTLNELNFKLLEMANLQESILTHIQTLEHTSEAIVEDWEPTLFFDETEASNYTKEGVYCIITGTAKVMFLGFRFSITGAVTATGDCSIRNLPETCHTLKVNMNGINLINGAGVVTACVARSDAGSTKLKVSKDASGTSLSTIKDTDFDTSCFLRGEIMQEVSLA